MTQHLCEMEFGGTHSSNSGNLIISDQMDAHPLLLIYALHTHGKSGK